MQKIQINKISGYRNFFLLIAYRLIISANGLVDLWTASPSIALAEVGWTIGQLDNWTMGLWDCGTFFFIAYDMVLWNLIINLQKQSNNSFDDKHNYD